MGILEGKVALVTGGGSGIGRASSVLFAKEGATVILTGRREKEGKETEAMIKQSGGNGLYVQMDVSKSAEVKDLIGGIVRDFGKLDCAFNCAGIDGKKASLVDSEEEDWDEIIDINLKGTYLLMKYEIKQMLVQGHGAIVNMASVCGVVARPNRSAYNASRHGVIGLTRTAAIEYCRKGIRINAVGPGSVKTDIYYRSTGRDADTEKAYANSHPIGRIAMPEEIAEAALWLCSDKASFVIGHTLMVDGGYTIQ